MLTFLPNRVSSSGKHHRRLSSSLDGTMRRLRLSDDASSSPSSADVEPGLPRRPLTDRPSSRLASTSQAGPCYYYSCRCDQGLPVWGLSRSPFMQALSKLTWYRLNEGPAVFSWNPSEQHSWYRCPRIQKFSHHAQMVPPLEGVPREREADTDLAFLKCFAANPGDLR